MRNKNGRGIKNLIALLLVVLTVAGLLPVGVSAAAPPSKTENSYGATTVTQEAKWTSPGTSDRKASVRLSFDGFDSVEQKGDVYDYVFLVDPSNSASEAIGKKTMKDFATAVLSNDPDAHFSIQFTSRFVATMLKQTNNINEVLKAIDNLNWQYRIADDVVEGGCFEAHNNHTKHKASSGCQRSLMFVVVGDGDFHYTPADMFNKTFTVDYHGDTYSVVTKRGPSSPSVTVLGRVYYIDGEFTAQRKGQYTVLKNGVSFSMPAAYSRYGTYDSLQMTAAFCQILYTHYLRDQIWPDAAFASLCIPGANTTNAYESSLSYYYGTRLKARWVADPGLNFEVTGNAIDFSNAYKSKTAGPRVVNFETTVDNRYFEVDQAALAAKAAALGDKCTYNISAVAGGQKVSFVYSATTAQELIEGVNVPVTLKSGIPAADIIAYGGYLPVVLDNAGGCSYRDLTGVVRDIRTGVVYLDVSEYYVTSEVVTGEATDITHNSATIINNTYVGITGTINSVAVQYSTSPTMASSTRVTGVVGSPYTVDLTGLQPDTTYYYRADVNTASETVFGEIRSFKTAIQQSEKPVINTVYAGSDVINGNGVAGAVVTVTLPEGTILNAVVNSGGRWTVDVPAGIDLQIGEVVSAVQLEVGKLVSDRAYTTVIEDPTIEPGIDLFVENMSTGLNNAAAGDTLLYDVIVTNNGNSSSLWPSAYVTFTLSSAVKLNVSSIRINNRIVTSSQYSYDSAANTLTLFLGDIPGGGGFSISFRALVNSDISNIDQVVLDAELGSMPVAGASFLAGSEIQKSIIYRW